MITLNEHEFKIRYESFPYWNKKLVVLEYLGLAKLSDISDYVKYKYLMAQSKYYDSIVKLYTNDFEYNSDKSKEYLQDFSKTIRDDLASCEYKMDEYNRQKDMYEKYNAKKLKQELYLSISKDLNRLKTEREKIQEHINVLISSGKYQDSGVEKQKMENMDKQVSDLKYQKDLVDQELMFLKSSIQEVQQPHGWNEMVKTKNQLEEILSYVDNEIKRWDEYDEIEATYKTNHANIKSIIGNKKDEIDAQIEQIEDCSVNIPEMETIINEAIPIYESVNHLFILMVKNLDKLMVPIDQAKITIITNNESTRKALIGTDYDIKVE